MGTMASGRSEGLSQLCLKHRSRIKAFKTSLSAVCLIFRILFPNLLESTSSHGLSFRFGSKNFRCPELLLGVKVTRAVEGQSRTRHN